MSQPSEDATYMCCECVPDSDLGVVLHVRPCEKHGPVWHRLIKRKDGLAQPDPAQPKD